MGVHIGVVGYELLVEGCYDSGASSIIPDMFCIWVMDIWTPPPSGQTMRISIFFLMRISSGGSS